MKISVGRFDNEQLLEHEKITIIIDSDTEFNIHLNKFGELVVNKSHFGSKSGAIKITPQSSNEIILT